MADTHFSEEERQLLLVFVLQAWARVKDDPEFMDETDECAAIIRKLSCADTVLIARRP
jgi:hypothetical protein